MVFHKWYFTNDISQYIAFISDITHVKCCILHNCVIFIYLEMRIEPAIHMSKWRINIWMPGRLTLEALHTTIIIIFILNPFRPEFTIVIFFHYKPQIAVAILDL